MKKKFVTSLTLANTLFLSIAFSQPIDAKTISEIEAEQAILDKESQELESSYKNQEKALTELEREKTDLEARTEEIQQTLNELTLQAIEQEKQLVEITKQTDTLKKDIKDLEAIISQRKEKIDEQFRFLQVKGNTKKIIEILINSENLSDLVGKSIAVSQIVSSNREILTAQIADQKELKEKESKLEVKRVEIEKLGDSIAVSKSNLLAQKNELDHRIQDLRNKFQLKEAEVNTILENKQNVSAKADQLTAEMKAAQDRIIAEEAEKQAVAQEEAVEMAGEIMPDIFEEESIAVVASERTEISSEAPPSEQSSSGFIRPSNGIVTSPFGYRVSPISGEWRLHGGIDLAGYGPIKAAQEGTVLVSGYHNSWGYYVKIDHGNGLQTLYAHMEAGSLTVSPGQKIIQGQQIGIMGTTGDSTGVHLHFEVYEDGTQVDPAGYVNF